MNDDYIARVRAYYRRTFSDINSDDQIANIVDIERSKNNNNANKYLVVSVPNYSLISRDVPLLSRLFQSYQGVFYKLEYYNTDDSQKAQLTEECLNFISGENRNGDDSMPLIECVPCDRSVSERFNQNSGAPDATPEQYLCLYENPYETMALSYYKRNIAAFGSAFEIQYPAKAYDGSVCDVEDGNCTIAFYFKIDDPKTDDFSTSLSDSPDFSSSSLNITADVEPAIPIMCFSYYGIDLTIVINPKSETIGASSSSDNVSAEATTRMFNFDYSRWYGFVFEYAVYDPDNPDSNPTWMWGLFDPEHSNDVVTDSNGNPIVDSGVLDVPKTSNSTNPRYIIFGSTITNTSLADEYSKYLYDDRLTNTTRSNAIIFPNPKNTHAPVGIRYGIGYISDLRITTGGTQHILNRSDFIKYAKNCLTSSPPINNQYIFEFLNDTTGETVINGPKNSYMTDSPLKDQQIAQDIVYTVTALDNTPTNSSATATFEARLSSKYVSLSNARNTKTNTPFYSYATISTSSRKRSVSLRQFPTSDLAYTNITVNQVSGTSCPEIVTSADYVDSVLNNYNLHLKIQDPSSTTKKYISPKYVVFGSKNIKSIVFPISTSINTDVWEQPYLLAISKLRGYRYLYITTATPAIDITTGKYTDKLGISDDGIGIALNASDSSELTNFEGRWITGNNNIFLIYTYDSAFGTRSSAPIASLFVDEANNSTTENNLKIFYLSDTPANTCSTYSKVINNTISGECIDGVRTNAEICPTSITKTTSSISVCATSELKVSAQCNGLTTSATLINDPTCLNSCKQTMSTSSSSGQS